MLPWARAATLIIQPPADRSSHRPHALISSSPVNDPAYRLNAAIQTGTSWSNVPKERLLHLTATMAENLSPLEQPSEKESKYYYYGLPSVPRLVARSSREPWTVGENPEGYAKQLYVVEGHDVLRELWNKPQAPGSLRDDMIRCLSQLDWKTMDILRAGYPRLPQQGFPTILFVTVPPGSTTWKDGVGFALRAKSVFEKHGIDDVHCEIKEGHLSSANSETFGPDRHMLERSLFIDDSIFIQSQFMSGIGTNIGRLRKDGGEGTKGLYLHLHRDGEESPTVVSLTCRHVALPTKTPPEAKVSFVQPGNVTLLENLSEVKDGKEQANNLRRIHQSSLDSNRIHESLKPEIVSEIDFCHRAIARYDTLIDKHESLSKNPDLRIIGQLHIAGAAELVKPDATRPHGDRWMRDWALIEMAQGNHNVPLPLLQNQIYGLSGKFASKAWETAYEYDLKLLNAPKPHPMRTASQAKREIPKPPELLQLDGLVEPYEIFGQGSTYTVENQADDKVLMVGKVGGSSGLSFGQCNKLKSVARHTNDSGDFTSTELCIVGKSNRGDRECGVPFFSRKGDSGSAVWTTDGRLLGMITSGVGVGQARFDTTYATPFVWLLEDMRNKYGLDVRLPKKGLVEF
ncbi:hypothetical protein B0I35DRAFT_480466 [Stachybotrys elegans]|uniref:Peptidase S1 domain-containing protein n=1 Tax=Stachybotrys elegans TaxID=80388 RepID=A0A8K0SMG2_9HYPO|nr:hypothetical protein B0I35DRAFT_480466 [Stachybotrys elegans]